MASTQGMHPDHEADLAILWNIIAGALIILMKSGFLLLEVGSVTGKAKEATLFHNATAIFSTAIWWYLFGYGLTGLAGDGDSAFFGGSSGGFLSTPDDQYAWWFVQFGFAAACVSILSGAVIGRIDIWTYHYAHWIIMGIGYSTLVHWAWDSEGWLFQMGFVDFAGSGVVHLFGAVCTLVGATILGPRSGRFDEHGAKAYPASDAVHQVLSAMLLLVGWFGFNCGSGGAVINTGGSIAQCAVNTLMGSAFGAFTAVLMEKFYNKNDGKTGLAVGAAFGALAGLVGVTGGCNSVHPGAACAIGAISGAAYSATYPFIESLGIDDPAQAFAVHGAGGTVGVLALAVIPTYTNGAGYAEDWDFAAAAQAQLAGFFATVALAVACSVPTFLVLKSTVGLEDLELVADNMAKYESAAAAATEACEDA